MEPMSKKFKTAASTSQADGGKDDLSGERKSTLFSRYLNFVQEYHDYSIMNFFKKSSPTTPPGEPVEMGLFKHIKLQDAILLNLQKQKLEVDEALFERIKWFFRCNFESVFEKIALQLLLHISKTESSSTLRYQLWNYLYLIQDFMKESPECVENVVKLSSDDIKQIIVEALKKPLILTALKEALKSVFVDVSDNFIEQKINDLNIYVSLSCFPPLPKLRGACLIDGFLICVGNLPDNKTSKQKYKADLITLGIHEFCHYVARVLCKDYNFSFPFKSGLDINCTAPPRFDSVLENKFLELGRNAELVLFDQIQPSWKLSSVAAAKKFLEQLEKPDATLPVINRSEFSALCLIAREKPSSGFGIDCEEDDSEFC